MCKKLKGLFSASTLASSEFITSYGGAMTSLAFSVIGLSALKPLIRLIFSLLLIAIKITIKLIQFK
jgi:hypothetical protein